jgi:transcriptional regulator
MTYIPTHFRAADEPAMHAFMQRYDFATIVSHTPDGLVVSHLPVLVRRSADAVVVAGHLARANDHWRVMDRETPAIAIFHGPHGYISPTWYESAPAVPTWNYAVVHAHGRPVANGDEAFVRGVLAGLVERYEGSRPDGWRQDRLPGPFEAGLLRAIIGFEMPVTRIEGKFKLGQNRSTADRRGAIAGLEREGSPEAALLAEFMRTHAGV